MLVATDFFNAEVWTSRGLNTYDVLFVMRVAQRRIQVVGITSAHDGLWMDQIARSPPTRLGADSDAITSREWLGGLLLFHYREAA